jgi:T5SS/PEP-CTERM-associated repeat protein/autotransporter-associated beta strand protein
MLAPRTTAVRMALLVALAAPFSPSHAAAGEIWDGGGADDDWTTGANWNFVGHGQVPPPNDGTANIHFGGNDGTTPNVDIPYSVNSLSFDAGALSFFIAGQELTIGGGGIVNNDNSTQLVLAPVKLSAAQTWNAAAGPLAADVTHLNGQALTLGGGFPISLLDAIDGAGSITVASGFASTATMSGNAANSYAGATTVSGGTLQLQKTGGANAIAGHLTIGPGGTVRLLANEQISNAASAVFASSGMLDLNGFNETVSYLSAVFNASVTTGGGTMTVLDFFSMGNNATFSGKLAVGDAESSVSSAAQLTASGDLVVGNVAEGSLLISTGADVSDVNGYIGLEDGSNGSATVTGNGSTWTHSGFLGIGEDGTGQLRVLDGAKVSNTHATVGQRGAATALVSGAGSAWTNSSYLEVGNNETGELVIDNGGVVTNADAYIGRLTGAAGTVAVRGTNSTWTNSGLLRVGASGAGSLFVESGGKVNAAGGVTANAKGAIDVNGGALDVDGALTMNGGLLTARAEGVVDVAGGQMSGGATAAIESGAQFKHAGTFQLVSDATLEVNSGASAQLSHLAIGTAAGPVAQFIVDGAGATVTSPMFINVGLGGTGAMTVSGGAQVTTASGAVGGFAPGTVGELTLDGADASGNPSKWTANVINVGFHADSEGSISILNGAKLELASFNVAAPGTASVRVEGADAMGQPSLLDVGAVTVATNPGAVGDVAVAGRGRMEIGSISMALAGGVATLTATDPYTTVEQSGASSIKLGHATDGAARLNVQNHARLTTGTAGIDVYATGQVNLESGAVLDARGPINVNGGQFNFLGGTLHAGAFNGNLVNEGGELAPGQSAGATAISGNYTQRQAARIEIEIGGVFPGEWDTVAVGGNALLDGVIEVKFIDGFEPAIGNSFEILATNVGNVGGLFDVEVLPTVNGVTFDVVYGPKSVTLVAQPGYSADFDNDGDVDANDLTQWRGDFGDNDFSDADADGDSDGLDFLAWQLQFGLQSATPVADVVPEPAAARQLVFALLLAVSFGKRVKSSSRKGAVPEP